MSDRFWASRLAPLAVVLVSLLWALATASPAGAASQERLPDGATMTPAVNWVPNPLEPGRVRESESVTLCVAASSTGGAVITFTFDAFAIPAGQKIDGVEAHIKYGTVGTHPVQLTNMGALVGDTRSMPPAGGASTCDGTAWTHAGTPTDKWGLALTPADFNAKKIGYQLRQNAITFPSGDPGGNTLDIDAAKLVVYFSPLNSPPVAEAGGPYTVAEGGSVVLSGAGSSDPDQAANTLDYDWDLDNNGSFETANTISPTFSAAGIDGPATRTVRLRVTDNGSLTDEDTATVNVTNVAPTITSVTNNGPINEGSSATVTVTATDPGGPGDPLTYSFDCDNNGAFEIGPQAGSSASCAFGDNGSFVVKVRVQDDDGGVANGQTTVVVLNVPPTITSIVNTGPIDEGGSVSVTVTATDPGGVNDPLTYAFDCDNDGGFEVGPQAGTTASCLFGDNGSFTIGVRVADDDGGVTPGSTVVTVLNVAPTAVLSTAGAVSFPGGDAFVGRKGVEQSHSAHSDDPGSDDLTFAWDFETSTESTTYFNDTGDPLGTPDPFPSPGPTFPFAADDTASVTFPAPGVYTVAVEVTDDDGGSASDSLDKLVTDDSDCARSQGFWRRAYRGDEQHLDNPTLQAYLDIVNFASAVFSEQVLAGILAEAKAVFEPNKGPGPAMRAKATQQALAAWLNFASGAVGLTEEIDVDGDGVGDTPFHVLMQDIEAILLNPGATHAQLTQAKDWAEAVNLRDADEPACR